MRGKAVRAVFVVGLVAAVLGLVPGDEATGHSCVGVESPAVTSTTLGDPSCEHHQPADHLCTVREDDPELAVCVDTS